MKSIILTIALLLPISVNAQQAGLTHEDKMKTMTAAMVSMTLVKCQASMSFMQNLFLDHTVVATIMQIDASATKPIVEGLKNDFYDIENRHISFLDNIMIKNGVPPQIIKGQGTQEFVVHRKAVHDKYQATPTNRKVSFVNSVLSYISVCKETADQIVRYHFKEFPLPVKEEEKPKSDEGKKD